MFAKSLNPENQICNVVVVGLLLYAGRSKRVSSLMSLVVCSSFTPSVYTSYTHSVTLIIFHIPNLMCFKICSYSYGRKRYGCGATIYMSRGRWPRTCPNCTRSTDVADPLCGRCLQPMHTFQCAFCGSADDVSRPPQQPDACLNQRPQPPVPTVGHKLAAVDEKHRREDEERRLGGEEQEDPRKLGG